MTPPGPVLVAGASGDLWFTRIIGSTIDHLKANGDVDTVQLPTEIGHPQDPLVSSDGNLWFESISQTPIFQPTARLTPTGDLAQFDGKSPFFAKINDQAVSPVSFLPQARLNHNGTAELIGINADGSPSFFNLPSGYQQNPDGSYFYRPLAVIIGADGAFWYTDGDAIARLNRDGAVTRFALPDNTAQADSLALGGDGSFWFTERNLIRVGDSVAYFSTNLNCAPRT